MYLYSIEGYGLVALIPAENEEDALERLLRLTGFPASLVLTKLEVNEVGETPFVLGNGSTIHVKRGR